ncbi:MAG: AI-2E family transporter [Longimicrobiales bacterium]
MPSRQGIDEWRVLYALIVLAVAGVMLLSVWPISPPIIFFLLLLVLSPYAGTHRHLLIVIGASTLLAIWVLQTLGGMLAPFIIALGIAYILDPAVDKLEERGVPRLAGVAILGVPVLVLFALLVLVGIPALGAQLEQLIASIPTATERVVEWLQFMRLRLMRMNLPFIDTDRLAAQLSNENIARYIQEHQAEILETSRDAVLGAGRQFGIVIAILGYLVLTPVLTIYLLRDFNTLVARAGSLFPESKRERWTSFLKEYDRLLARFLRGQLVAAAIVGVLTWLGLLIVGFPYSGLVGAFAGIFNVVPYLGLVVSVIPVLLISLLSGSFFTTLLKAGIIFTIVQLIDGSVTGPRIIGSSVGLHPVWVILALAVGSFFFGFVGLLLAMPGAVLVKLLIREAVVHYRQSNVFRGTMTADDAV